MRIQRIPVGRNGEHIALVDAEDFDLVSTHKWHLGGGYARRSVYEDGQIRAVLMHRMIMGCTRGDGIEIDHINRDKLDNRRCNLRMCSHAQNTQNVGAYKGSTSIYRAVYLERRRNTTRWRAAVRKDGVLHSLGRFVNEIDAGVAAEVWRRENVPFATHDHRLDAEIERRERRTA